MFPSINIVIRISFLISCIFLYVKYILYLLLVSVSHKCKNICVSFITQVSLYHFLIIQHNQLSISTQPILWSSSPTEQIPNETQRSNNFYVILKAEELLSSQPDIYYRIIRPVVSHTTNYTVVCDVYE